MEMTGEDGSTIELNPGSSTVRGRGSGFSTTDRTVSRRHVLFWFEDSDDRGTEPRACFEVIGRNPIWVRSGKMGEVKGFRRKEKGGVAVGDWLCFGGQRPVWFAVKRRSEFEDVKEMEVIESSDLNFGELDSVDVSTIDPVKEFGFLVIGHEFDQYSKEKFRDIHNWDWFLEEPRKDSDEDDDVFDKRKKRGVRRKRGKAKRNNEDEDDWTGESEEDKEVIAKVKKIQRPIYSTRSKDCSKLQKGGKIDRSLVQKKAIAAKAEEETEDNDPTLGGFIVDDEELEAESDVNQEEEEEEEEEEEFDDNDGNGDDD